MYSFVYKIWVFISIPKQFLNSLSVLFPKHKADIDFRNCFGRKTHIAEIAETDLDNSGHLGEGKTQKKYNAVTSKAFVKLLLVQTFANVIIHSIHEIAMIFSL